MNAASYAYVDQKDLIEIDNPQKLLEELPTKMKDDDWNVQVESVNQLRSIVKNHSDKLKELDSYHFRDIITSLSELVVSLRSCIAKTSLITISEVAV